MSNNNIPYYSILSSEFINTLKGHAMFELTSKFGRTFLNRKPRSKKNAEKNLLNLGAGTLYYDGWINADFFYLPIKFWKKSKYRIPEWMLDLRYPLNCDDNFFDGVFTEHTLEHLYPYQVLNLLKELNRTMKSGAWLRIAVPDLEKYVDYYVGKESHKNFSEMWPENKAAAIRNITQNYLHISTWDGDLLVKFCEMAGFVNAKKVDFGIGTDKTLIKDDLGRSWETLYVEAQKA